MKTVCEKYDLYLLILVFVVVADVHVYIKSAMTIQECGKSWMIYL